MWRILHYRCLRTGDVGLIKSNNDFEWVLSAAVNKWALINFGRQMLNTRLPLLINFLSAMLAKEGKTEYILVRDVVAGC